MTQLWCPSDPIPDSISEDAICSMDCTFCPNTTVYTEGITDFNSDLIWKCMNTSTSCTASRIQCGDIFNELVFDSLRSEWIYDVSECTISTSNTTTTTTVEPDITSLVICYSIEYVL